MNSEKTVEIDEKNRKVIITFPLYKNYRKNDDFAEIFFIFCMCTSFTFAVKPTGSILIINLIIFFLFLYRKIYDSFKKLFFENFIFDIQFIKLGAISCIS